jgi:hypothetical protein
MTAFMHPTRSGDICQRRHADDPAVATRRASTSLLPPLISGYRSALRLPRGSTSDHSALLDAADARPGAGRFRQSLFPLGERPGLSPYLVKARGGLAFAGTVVLVDG